MPTPYYDLDPGMPSIPFPQDAFKDATPELMMEYLLKDIDPSIDTTGLTLRELAALVERSPLDQDARDLLIELSPELLSLIER